MQVECGSNFPFPICFTLMEEQAAPRVYIGSLDFGVTQHALRLSMQGLGFEGHIEKIQIIRAGRHSVHRLCSAFVTVGSQEQAQILARLLCAGDTCLPSAGTPWMQWLQSPEPGG